MACPVDNSHNLENQEDELLALCSIYDDRVFARSNDEMEGQINVHLHLPDHFEVKIAPKRVQRQRSHSSDGLRHSGDEPTCSGPQEWEVFQVKYLPPIVLNFSLPPGYPSSEPPEFTLSCKWLTVMQLSKLCKIMDSQWDESPCDVILFRWIQFLQEDSVNVLELTSPLVLNSKMFTRQCTSRPGNSSSNHDRVARDCDPRAVQDVSSCSVLLDIILDYDQQEKERVFQTNHHSCGVCFCEKLGSACILFPKCDHVFCTECIAEYFKVQIENGSVKALMCPETECDSQALPSQVKNVVSPDLFAKYDKFLLQSSLNEMSDIVYCPRPTCQSPVILERDVTVGVCLVCRFAFCSLCKLTFHGVSPCKFRPDDIKKLKIEYENANPAEKLFLERRYGKNRIRRMIDEFNSEEWLLDNSKACPRCGTHIQKSEGCNKMTCSKCRTHFCWLCGKILNHQNPYGHFNAYNSSCFNRLFEGVEIDENEDDEEPFW